MVTEQGPIQGILRFFAHVSNAKIEKPFELGGRKMRANTPENGDMINAIGGVAQFMPITDVYPAAQRKVISGLYTSSNAVLATKLDEVTQFGNVANTQWVSGGQPRIRLANSWSQTVAGTLPIPNLVQGIKIQSPGNTVGGDTPAKGNVISGNGTQGVRIENDVATGNAVLGNRIYGNCTVGIDLAGDGVTLNDAQDVDVGP